MASIEPLSGFRQFSKGEAVAVIDAKNAQLSEKLERELRDMQENMHNIVREIVKDQMELLQQRVKQNTEDIRDMYKKSTDEEWKSKMEAMIRKNTENITIVDANIKSVTNSLQ